MVNGFYGHMVKCKCGGMVMCKVGDEQDGDLIKHSECKLKGMKNGK